MIDITEHLECLRESNNIEDVFDDDSLIQAWKAWDYLLTQTLMTPAVLLCTHAMLMAHQPLEPRPGRYRSCEVRIGGRLGEPWGLVPGLIRDWCQHVNESHDWQGDHVTYERIHPFVDGNGRTGRMFLNWQRLRIGESLLTIKNAEKAQYYAWFR